MSPAVAYALNRPYSETDLREVFPAVRVPALVLYRSPEGNRGVEGRGANPVVARDARLRRRLFRHLPLARRRRRDRALRRAEKRRRTVPESVLATILFTDIVGSTERAAELGDRAWRDLLGQHNALVRRELGRFRGEERDTAGDGFFATFDGPARAIRCAQAIVSERPRASGSSCEPASTSANASSTKARLQDSRSASAPASQPRPAGRGTRLRHGPRPRRRLRASSSRAAASTTSKASPHQCASTQRHPNSHHPVSRRLSSIPDARADIRTDGGSPPPSRPSW